MTLDSTTAAKLSAEYARAALAGDRTGIDAALLLLADGQAEATDEDVATLLAAQAHQLAQACAELARLHNVDVDHVLEVIAGIALPP